jgi:hypothetical protein
MILGAGFDKGHCAGGTAMEGVQVVLRERGRSGGAAACAPRRKRGEFPAGTDSVLAEAYTMKPDELDALQKVVESNAEAIEKAWHRYPGN